jgi:D-glycero-D-manno-heptose 1,7-bisphosphate phosphatase
MNTALRHPALFLDRDGVINVEKNYVHRIEDFEFVTGIFELCTVATGLGLWPVVVTNQAGIGRGYYTEADFQALTNWMLKQFRARGIAIVAVYHCPFHPTAGVGPYRRESFDRKPNPGMLLKAAADLRLDLSRSVFVGDKDSDMAAGRAAGVGHLIRLVGDVTAHAPGPARHERVADDIWRVEQHVNADVAVVRGLDEAAARLRELVERAGR